MVLLSDYFISIYIDQIQNVSEGMTQKCIQGKHIMSIWGPIIGSQMVYIVYIRHMHRGYIQQKGPISCSRIDIRYVYQET